MTTLSRLFLLGNLLLLAQVAQGNAQAPSDQVLQAASTNKTASTRIAAPAKKTRPMIASDTIDALTLVTEAIDLTRGLSSYSEMTMTIKRPSWERSSTLVAWTRGREDALIRFTAPAKDAGNALLKQGDNMWTFNPKLNRNIRLPNSMMSQSWAGSDFSYNDLSRSDKYLRHYNLALVDTQQVDGHTLYTIDAVPKEDAPVVWGKERMIIRDDYVMTQLTYFDQDLEPLKQMTSLDIGEMGGRTIAISMRMVNLEEPDSYTEVRYNDLDFEVELEDRMFTVFALQSGRTR